MTKTKANLPIPLLLVALIVFVSGTGIGTDNSFIDGLKEKLAQYNHDYYVERTYVMTDRYVYRPGDDLWFNGFVASSDLQAQQSYSEDFYIKLLSSNGEELAYRRYPLANNQTSGRLLIPRSSIPGRYWLVAYTGWMKNRCSKEAFRKEILISKYFEKRFQVEVTYDKVVYYPHDTLNAGIRILDPAGKPIAETVFEYTVGSFARQELKGTGKTDIRGESKIRCTIPNSEEMLLLAIEIRSRKLSGDYTLIIPSVTYEPEIAFFAESGNLVSGLKNIMVLRAVSSTNQPAIITGDVIDDKGNVLQTIRTGVTGKVKFEYCPSKEACYFKITKPEGITKKYPLPMANKHGFVLHLLQSGSDSAKISIISSDDRTPTTTYWVAVMNKQVIWSKLVCFTESTNVSIPLKDLKSGILQVSVFDQNYDLVAERLIKINNEPERLSAKTDHQVYHNRQRVNLLLEYPENFKNDNLALSVSLNNLAYNSQETNFNAANYSGQCEMNSTYSHNSDLINDIDLLTTAYRNVYWRDVLATTGTKKPYIRHDGLTGKVVDRKDNVSQHAKVRLTNISNYRTYETQSDENGSFQVFFGSDIIDYKYLNVDAYNALGKVNLTATIDLSYVEELKNTLIEESENKEQQKTVDVLSFGEPDLIYALRYGPGKFRKSDTESKRKYDPNKYTNYTDLLEIIQDIKPYRLKNNKIIFTNVDENMLDSSGLGSAIIVINGTLKGNDINTLKNLLPSDITNINISTSLLDVHKYTPLNFNGVVEITTIQGMYRYRQPHMQIGSNTLNTGREFYSPDYSVESSTSGDSRKTLYWNPKISLYSEKVTLVTFYTSDIKGIFYGHLLGIDDTGNPIECEFTFKVE